MRQFVWLNEGLTPTEQARVSVNDRGFLFGDGLFETLRADAGQVQFLREHLRRLENSARALRLCFPGGIDWRGRLGEVIAANGLQQATARLKILLTRGAAPGLGLPAGGGQTRVIWAEAYTPPAPEEYKAGWPVVVFPERRMSFLGRHKSLNYLFSLAARQFAQEHGAREAIVLEADSMVSEAAAANLLYLKNDHFYIPEAASALPGVTLTVIRRGLEARGYPVVEAATTVAMLTQAGGVWLTNSLMGLMPVSAIDGTSIPVSTDNRLLQEVWRGALKADRQGLPTIG